MRAVLLLCFLGSAASVSGQTAETAPSGLAVDVSEGVVPFGVGLRYETSEGIAVGVALDRTAYDTGDPEVFVAFSQPERRAYSLAATVESGGYLWRGRLYYGSGFQAFYHHQEDDLVTGYDGVSDPVVREGGRRSDGVGVGYLTRAEIRVVGPAWVGASASLLGVSRYRILGGTEEDGGVIRVLDPEVERSRWSIHGGPTRIYAAIRL